ncbi:MAG: 3-dehydroquinate synthase [Zetaproteobacteria bacterium]|nr:MAG: 3-dehydroquinate synthase [Zetaproteobacteria bacterium]
MHEKVYRVELGARSYDIHIEPDSLPRLGRAMRALLPDAERCLVVSNETVAPLYLEQLEASLREGGWHSTACILPDGEQFKTLRTWSKILDALMEARIARNEPIVALGGGVIGDMAGFAAACYRRGIPFVQVPTTLLAQVDSSVGGKTGINHEHGKNMIGAFYQPRLVWIDPLMLRTLDARQVRAGLAEVIKYGLIRDAAFFDWLDAHMPDALQLDAMVVSELIHESCRHKAEVVMADETEQGMRALLNLGHTFGHAIEAMTAYRRYLHGEAVALGLLMAARMSAQMGYADAAIEARICACLKRASLPTEVPAFPAERWLDAMGHDKKNIGTQIRFVLLKRIGQAFISADVRAQDVRRLIDSYRRA